MSYCLNPNCPKPQNPPGGKFCQYCGVKMLLNQRYRAIKLIGQGGFGRTFLAIDEHKPSKPTCVIKQFLPQNDNAKATQLFEQEAVRLDDLGTHPQIPELYAHFSQDQRQYLIQQFIEGENLSQKLTRTGVFHEIEIMLLLQSILPLLDFIHSHNIIHRDIKPDNIIQTPDNELFLVDFGAAKYANMNNMNKTGTSIGTPEFIAPEQTRGKAIFASDLYSLGVTCIYLMTNISPFDLYDINEDRWIWADYLVDNPVSEHLQNILNKLIENTPKKRYQSAQEVLKDLANQSSAIIHQPSEHSNKFLDRIYRLSKSISEAIALDWTMFTLHYEDHLDLYAKPQVVGEYIYNHRQWFPGCATPLKVSSIGKNGYDILVGKYGAFRFEVEVRIGLELLPANADGIYKINSINLPNYTPPGYQVDFQGSFQLHEIVMSKSILDIFKFTRKKLPDIFTRWEYQLDLEVGVKFPKFIRNLPESMIKKTGDRIIMQIVKEVSKRLCERVQNDFHHRLGIDFNNK
jgi:serine/threonine protein kinase